MYFMGSLLSGGLSPGTSMPPGRTGHTAAGNWRKGGAPWLTFRRRYRRGSTSSSKPARRQAWKALPPDITPADFTDWRRMSDLVADSVPLWVPGTAHGYHAWTFGWLVGETVRRATGRTLAEVLAEDVAGPLGVPDELFFGVPDSD